MGNVQGRTLRVIAVSVTATAGAIVPLVVAASPAGADVLTVSPTGSVLVKMRGSGHGRGMSQYGARGAAIAGKTDRQIASFYYPNTTLDTVPSRRIRVRLSGFGSTTTVAAAYQLTVTGVSGWLPASGISRYRLVADAGSGLTLQRLSSATGSTWQTYRTGLPDRAEFHRADFYAMRLFGPDGWSTSYFGYLRASRAALSGSSGGTYTVDRLSLDNYTAGVVPREMSTSWQRAAVNTQALAARTYGRYAIDHPESGNYDLCDSSQCQVYGGRYRYDSQGQVVYTDYAPAAVATSNQVLRYQAQAIFAQFGASNGGWTVAGGQPYLPAKADPYDNASSSDPYLLYQKTVTVASVARYYGLARLTKITISARDGNGYWGGRVLAGYVDGTDSAGNAKRVQTTGYGLQNALGTSTTWLSLANAT